MAASVLPAVRALKAPVAGPHEICQSPERSVSSEVAQRDANPVVP
ncbi:hypothetical protein T261_00934 [Streptomyces lydicus]|nr:hypothetical protein T261_00934 [Streptomyces lydicus]